MLLRFAYVSIRLGVVAQAERLASFSELAPEVAFRVFPENSRTFHHCLMLADGERQDGHRVR